MELIRFGITLKQQTYLHVRMQIAVADIKEIQSRTLRILEYQYYLILKNNDSHNFQNLEKVIFNMIVFEHSKDHKEDQYVLITKGRKA